MIFLPSIFSLNDFPLINIFKYHFHNINLIYKHYITIYTSVCILFSFIYDMAIFYKSIICMLLLLSTYVLESEGEPSSNNPSLNINTRKDICRMLENYGFQELALECYKRQVMSEVVPETLTVPQILIPSGPNPKHNP